MELPSVSALEFEQIKTSIKNFIKTKTDFQDYDFEGSNLSMLVDVLAYNTMYSSYNINMAANELNLDTAVLRDNVVSHAKKLGYVPNSYVSSKMGATITVSNVGSYSNVELAAGTIFSTSQNNETFTFLLRDPISVVPINGVATFENITFEEGTEFSITYIVDESNEHQRFFVPNNFVDSNTVRVFVKTDTSSTIEEEYTRKVSIVDVKPNDTVFFVEEIQDQKYEIVFGDDVIGRKLQNGEIIRINYIVTKGSKANNIKLFNFVGKVYGLNSGVSSVSINASNITTNIVSVTSDGGSEFEPIKSIKYRAPRYYAAQQRAVTTSDYESIIMNIYSNAELVKVSGGEELNPPQYGKVFITIKPKVGEKISEFTKQEVVREIKNFIVGSITPVIKDADRISIVVSPVVVFDARRTKKNAITISSLIQQVIVDFNNLDEFKNFGGVYSSSKLLCNIKDVDSSIKFSLVRTYFKRPVTLFANQEYKYKIDFYTKLKNRISSRYTLISDPFSIVGLNRIVFLSSLSYGAANCIDDTNVYLTTTSGLILGSVGTIDYETGKVEFTVTAFENTTINIYVIPANPDITTSYETYPEILIDTIGVVDVNDTTDETLNPEVILPITSVTTDPATISSIAIDPTGITPVPTSTTPGTTSTGSDGSVTTTYPDGTTITELPDGTTIVKNPDGTSTTTNPDGTSTNSGVPSSTGTGDTTTDDPNNNATIDDFTPETQPDTCT